MRSRRCKRSTAPQLGELVWAGSKAAAPVGQQWMSHFVAQVVALLRHRRRARHGQPVGEHHRGRQPRGVLSDEVHLRTVHLALSAVAFEAPSRRRRDCAAPATKSPAQSRATGKPGLSCCCGPRMLRGRIGRQSPARSSRPTGSPVATSLACDRPPGANMWLSAGDPSGKATATGNIVLNRDGETSLNSSPLRTQSSLATCLTGKAVLPTRSVSLSGRLVAPPNNREVP